jgi:hypothetical protein
VQGSIRKCEMPEKPEKPETLPIPLELSLLRPAHPARPDVARERPGCFPFKRNADRPLESVADVGAGMDADAVVMDFGFFDRSMAVHHESWSRWASRRVPGRTPA